MKNTLKYLMALVVLLVPSVAFGQAYTLTQTTLSAKVGANDTSFQLASVTNVTGVITSNNTDLYIDRELMQVVSVNTTSGVVSVLRGVSGTQAGAHASGDMVLSGPPAAFVNYDPQGYCSTTAPKSAPEYVPAQPTINTRTGNQWLCSSITTTWVPGFVNTYNPSLNAVTVVVASVGGATLPSGPLFHVSGTNAITSWTQPIGCNATAVGGCTFVTIPDAAFTWAGGGNMAATGTAVANLPIIWTWDATNSKWVALQSK